MKGINIKKLFQIILAISLIIFLILPIKVPRYVASLIELPLGIITLLSLSVILFIYFNPFLAFLFIVSVYELLRRSSVTLGYLSKIHYSPRDNKHDNEILKNNDTRIVTLEEDMISKMAPLESNDDYHYIDSTFKPVSDDTHNAFIVK